VSDRHLLKRCQPGAGSPAPDISAPLNTAWQLSHAWPDAELIIVEDAGHLGNAAIGAHLRAARLVAARAAALSEVVLPRGLCR
jgi:hypothetical protein